MLLRVMRFLPASQTCAQEIELFRSQLSVFARVNETKLHINRLSANYLELDFHILQHAIAAAALSDAKVFRGRRRSMQFEFPFRSWVSPPIHLARTCCVLRSVVLSSCLTVACSVESEWRCLSSLPWLAGRARAEANTRGGTRWRCSLDTKARWWNSPRPRRAGSEATPTAALPPMVERLGPPDSETSWSTGISRVYDRVESSLDLERESTGGRS
jgi:hypothetical protein